jgi:hypothetical protein
MGLVPTIRGEPEMAGTAVWWFLVVGGIILLGVAVVWGAR